MPSQEVGIRLPTLVPNNINFHEVLPTQEFPLVVLSIKLSIQTPLFYPLNFIAAFLVFVYFNASRDNLKVTVGLSHGRCGNRNVGLWIFESSACS